MKEMNEREMGHFKDMLLYLMNPDSQFRWLFSTCSYRVILHPSLLFFVPLEALGFVPPGSLGLPLDSGNGRE